MKLSGQYPSDTIPPFHRCLVAEGTMMKEILGASILACSVAVTACGSLDIVADNRQETVLVAFLPHRRPASPTA